MAIYVDAMGGDYAPYEIIKGAAQAVKEFGEPITLIGNRTQIETVIKENHFETDLPVIHAGEVITFDEDPTAAVRRKKDSSIAVGAALVKENRSSVFISAGSTGALLAASLLITGRIKGVRRPALAVLAAFERPVLLLDVGANADCKAEYLQQFAVMGSVYMRAVMGVDDPEVGLLNIGAEDVKGSELVKDAFSLIASDVSLNFRGNIEPKDIFTNNPHVIVADGFTGNIVLKSIESTSRFVLNMLNGVIHKNALHLLAGGILKKELYAKKDLLDPKVYGGSPLLGIDGGIFKAHGNSDALAIKNAVKQAVLYQKSNVRDKILNAL